MPSSRISSRSPLGLDKLVSGGMTSGQFAVYGFWAEQRKMGSGAPLLDSLAFAKRTRKNVKSRQLALFLAESGKALRVCLVTWGQYKVSSRAIRTSRATLSMTIRYLTLLDTA